MDNIRIISSSSYARPGEQANVTALYNGTVYRSPVETSGRQSFITLGTDRFLVHDVAHPICPKFEVIRKVA